MITEDSFLDAMSYDHYPDLFEAGEDWQMNACLSFLHDMHDGYIEGYLRAADRLVRHVAETGRDQDYLVYPIAFMYRQHLELQLKRIIDTGRRLLTDKGGHPTHHKLRDLWPLAKDVLRGVWNNEPDPAEFRLIDHFVDQFSRIDLDSTAFRYPTNKAGSPTLEGVRHINLRNLGECVQSFSGFLDGAASALVECLHHKQASQREGESW